MKWKKHYIKMHELGYAHSAEVWKEGKLAGDYMVSNWAKYFLEKVCSVKSVMRQDMLSKVCTAI